MKMTHIKKYLHPMTPLPTDLSARGDPRAKINCILFDIYGTLFISGSGDISLGQRNSPAHEEVRRLLAKYAIAQAPRRILNKLYDGIQVRHGVLRDSGVDYPEVIIEQIWRQVLEIDDQEIIKQFAVEFELIANPVWTMPNLGSMLSACRQKKMLMGIISNAQFYTPSLFNWFLNRDPQDLGFDPGLLFYSYQYEVAKPSPALFKMAAAIGVLPQIEREDGTLLTEASLLWLGDVVLCAVPGELLPKLGLQYRQMMKEAGGRITAVIGLANDELGYILPAEDFTSPENYLEPGSSYEESMSVSATAGPALTSVLQKLLEK